MNRVALRAILPASLRRCSRFRMADVAVALAAITPGPAQQSERIVPIDVLRGVALLGILVMNIQSFSMISAAYGNPTAYGDLTGINFAVWLAGRLLADQKFMTIFAMLFGAGIVLMTERQVRAGARPAGIYYRRNGILMLIGVLHAYLFWEGDILFSYGACAMVVYFARRLPPRWLLPIGYAMICVPALFIGAVGLALPFAQPETLVDAEKAWSPTPEMVQKELDAYRGNWFAQVAQRAPESVLAETILFAIWTFWRAAGLMLVGMALFQLGVFNAARSPRLYWTFVLLGLPLGVGLTGLGVYRDFDHGWDLSCKFFGMNYNYFGSLFASLAWVGLVMLACQSKMLPALVARLAAVGQMALTNYLLQTLICTTLFYGTGFGLFGKVQRVGQLGIVCSIWAFELLFSSFWLAYFTSGPFEWLWRSLTYWQRQPFLKNQHISAA